MPIPTGSKNHPREWWGGPPGPRGTPSSRSRHNDISILRGASRPTGRRPRTRGSAPPILENQFFMGFRGPKAHSNRPQTAMVRPTGLPDQAQLEIDLAVSQLFGGGNRRQGRGRESAGVGSREIVVGNGEVRRVGDVGNLRGKYQLERF